MTISNIDIHTIVWAMNAEKTQVPLALHTKDDTIFIQRCGRAPRLTRLLLVTMRYIDIY